MTDRPVTMGGHLVLVVGPSGAGKDTLIARVAVACSGDPAIVFPRRIVTRAPSIHESNHAVGEADFAAARDRGDYALHWEAHGLSYALPQALDHDLAAGRTVVANVSRRIVDAARRRYGAAAVAVTVVLVTAPPEMLAARLAARGRASDGNIDHRLRREVDAIVPDIVIENTGPVDDHARELLAAIRSCRPHR